MTFFLKLFWLNDFMKLVFEGFGVFIAPGKQQKQSVPEKAHVGVACVSGRGWRGAEWAVRGVGQGGGGRHCRRIS